MFGIVKDVHINAGFSKGNGRTQFGHAGHGAYELDKFIIRFHTDVEFNLGLGNHIVQIFQMSAGEFQLFSLVCFNVVAPDRFNDFIGLGFSSLFNKFADGLFVNGIRGML